MRCGENRLQQIYRIDRYGTNELYYPVYMYLALSPPAPEYPITLFPTHYLINYPSIEASATYNAFAGA